MAHHKRKSRRKDKRIMYGCGCCEDVRRGKRGRTHNADSEICMGKSRAKKRPKKQKCEGGGSHIWMHVTEIQTGTTEIGKGAYWRCDQCLSKREQFIHGGWTFWVISKVYCDQHLLVRTYTQNVKTSICVKCDEMKVKTGNKTYNDKYTQYSQKLDLPKRKVTLY